jgi:Transposase DDE domain
MKKLYDTKLNQIFGVGNFFGGKINLSRKKFIISYLLGLIMSRSVQFSEVAAHLNEEVELESNVRRIERFFKEFECDFVGFARLLMSCYPCNTYKLCIDRTNWRFGNQNINVLCLTIEYQGIGIPILFELLDKKGNSSQDERVNLLDKFIAIFGSTGIQTLIGDREFIGENWYNYLIDKGIKFHIRIPKSHYIGIGDEQLKGSDLLDKYGAGFHLNIEISGMKLNFACKKSKNKKGEDDPLLILTNDDKSDPFQTYRKRWSIETFFQSLKKRGFNLENTHLKCLKKLKKLFLMVAIAFVMCLTIGIFRNDTHKKIKVKKHGYKANSFARNGLNIIRNAINKRNKCFTIFEQLADDFIFVISGFFNLKKKRYKNVG